LVESVPVGTSLDHPDIPDAHQVWLEMIEGAQMSLDFAMFYAVTKPDSRLEPILDARRRRRGSQARGRGSLRARP
jgi:hypothetical protein